MISRTTFSRDIETLAKVRAIDPDLIEAVVIHESGGHPYACRPEHHYQYLWDVKQHQPFRKLQPGEIVQLTAPDDFPKLAGTRDQEWQNQRMSWGLMQVMGAVARELGFMGLYLPEICRPEINLELGSKLLSRLLKQAGGDYQKALAAYNAGWGGRESPAGLAYAGSVLSIVDQL